MKIDPLSYFALTAIVIKVDVNSTIQRHYTEAHSPKKQSVTVFTVQQCDIRQTAPGISLP